MTYPSLNFTHLQEKYGDLPALIWPSGELTYNQYFQYINYVSNILKDEDVKPGSKVAIISDIHHHFPILLFAVLISGGIAVPVNPKLTANTIQNIIKEIKCDMLLTIDDKYSSDLNLDIKVLPSRKLNDFFSDNKYSEPIPSIRFENKATVIFTSGSSGHSKGVLHTIGNHYYNALGSNQNIRLNQNDCWMVALPFYHIAGIAILFRTLIAGAACFIAESANDISTTINNYHITHLSLVATQLYRWILNNEFENTFESIKAILLGGSQIPPSLIKRALQLKLPVFTSYGSTEMSSQISTTSDDDLIKNPASSGKVLPYRQLKINKKNEILVKGKTLCHGYVSKKKIINCCDKKGWFHTGDLGYFDQNNNLIVIGRQDNMFISGGENIFPEEIEQYLQFHHNISEACVVGTPDDEFGARPIAFIKMIGVTSLDESQLKKYLEDKIVRFKIPVRFFPWPQSMDQFKIDRKSLRELAIAKLKRE